MQNDNSQNDNMGHLPGKQEFWRRGETELVLYRHCEGVFTLEDGGILVLPPGPFEQINAYLWAEFDVMGA